MDANNFTFQKEVSVSLSQFRQMFLDASCFYERYLESLNEQSISVGQWSSTNGNFTRNITFEHKMSSFPGVPYIQTLTEQKYSHIPEKEIVVREKSTFTGVSFLDEMLVERTWSVEPNSTGIMVTISAAVSFSEDGKLPKFVRRQIEKKSFKDMENSMNIWASMVDNDLLENKTNSVDEECKEGDSNV
mmetsp:Transcript_25510/g.33334  ORF Transcript_25510/g.33334 Transcript_25510/m.33334 type:complete len:188 (+) Transcript_25510:162-725(+)|eukprot:CAMPEP_0117802744 /NCGR_PEP_ID=MMETSP0948-20121206/15944_1 /TAXON_ID=44440 /ORGANISM="Chattonella subsalsa, Strain CCMP2191" /LENGTH=187 /DNA_ID=CAMNT_0005635665 /DNA_START=174 /DNA_END=737 /DNA_ORIENTATION=+